jgi:hypothetical protein
MRENTLQIAKNTSIQLLEETVSINDILETCKNLCKLIEISNANSWLDLEVKGYLMKYKTRDELYQNLPSYRKTDWNFYDLYGNLIALPPDMMNLFGKSILYHPIRELEIKDQIVIEKQFLAIFNKFISEHGMDEISKNLRIHQARISKDEVAKTLEGVKKRIQELLDMIITLLEIE